MNWDQTRRMQMVRGISLSDPDWRKALLTVACLFCWAGDVQAAEREQRIDSVCARVRIRLEQEAVITRTAFKATLEINNESTTPGDSVDNVLVRLEIRDANGSLANNLFGIPEPTLENISDISGGGSIAAGTTAKAEWLILPTDEAAPTEGPTPYFFGGEFIYFKNGSQVTVPLYPVRIEVLPDAKLFLKYFLQSPVYSDNPFTEVKEVAEPFSLGLLVQNTGLGTARNLRITSAEPEIVDNYRGLAIAFSLLDTQLGTQPITNSFTINFGDISPATSKVARWRLTASLQGRFIDYSASFEHVGGLGDPRLSLIEDVDIFELNHVVVMDDDPQPDFLVNNPPAVEEDDLPDEIHSSLGVVLPLFVTTNAVVDSPVGRMDLSVQLTANLQEGWNYIRVPDPGQGRFRLVQVTNITDGGTVLTGGPGDICNAWTTHRWLPVDGPPTGREDRLHLFVRGLRSGPVDFMLDYSPLLRVDQVVVNDGLDQRSNTNEIVVDFSEPSNIPALIDGGLIADAVTLWERAGGGMDTQIVLESGRYSFDAATSELAIDLTVDGAGSDLTTMLADGNYELRLDTSLIMSTLGTSLPDDDGDDDGIYRFGDKEVHAFYRLAGDATGDRVVNFLDLQVVRAAWLLSEGMPGYDPNADLNSDGVVNFLDLQTVRNAWLNSLSF